MLLFPAWLGFNGKAYAEGPSFAHLDEQQFDARLDLWDDGTDPRALGRPYDAEGTPKRRVDLVRGGITVGLAHDRRSAALAGTESTGSSIGQDSFGGYAGDLFLAGGDETLDQLIAGVERGLLVTDFWYNRILDPKTQVVTGLTRNGLFLIEHGEVTQPVQNLRYTQSVVGAPGSWPRPRPRQRRRAGGQRGRDRARPQPPPGRLGVHRQRPRAERSSPRQRLRSRRGRAGGT